MAPTIPTGALLVLDQNHPGVETLEVLGMKKTTTFGGTNVGVAVADGYIPRIRKGRIFHPIVTSKRKISAEVEKSLNQSIKRKKVFDFVRKDDSKNSQ